MKQTSEQLGGNVLSALASQFPEASQEQLGDILHESSVQKFSDRQTVFFKGDPSPCIYLLVSGRIYIYADSAAGNRVILNVITPGQLFGEIGVIDEGERSAHAEAVKSAEVLTIPASSLQTLMQQSPPIANRLMKLIAARLRNTTEQMNDAGLFDSRQRLARLILRLQQQAGGGKKFDFSFSQTDLAALTATSRETVNRHLNEWRRAGILEIGNQKVTVLDAKALRAIR